MTQHSSGVPWRTHTLITLLRAGRRAVIGAILFALVASGLVLGGATAANAAPGDYTVDLTGPASIPIYDSFTYTATVTSEATSTDPATGIVLTSVLAPGLAFDPSSVDTGSTSPVASVSYDAATRTITFTMKPLVEVLSSFSYTVTQVQNNTKSDKTVFDTTLAGNASSNGVVPAPDSVNTAVTGNYDYTAQKSATTLVGSNNRLVTYSFNMRTNDSSNTTETFSTAAQRFMDSFPAGSVYVSSSATSQGSWNVNYVAGSVWTAEWSNTQNYGPTNIPLTVDQTGVWITVQYPENSTFPNGTRPPVNTVGLQVLPVGADPADPNAWIVRNDATAQGPELGPSGGPVFGLQKTNSNATPTAGYYMRAFNTTASFIGGDPAQTQTLSNWVIEDSASNPGNAAFWQHVDIKRVQVSPNSVLNAAAVPYTIQYSYTLASNPAFDSGWKSVGNNPGSANTNTVTTFSTGGGNDGVVLFNTAGSTGYNEFSWPTETIPAGAILTGWKVTLATTADAVPSGSQVTIGSAYIPLYKSYVDGSSSATPLTNTSHGSATTDNGTALTPVEASTSLTFLDSAYVMTNITAPTTLQVNGSGNYVAGIVNQNEQDTYHGGVMKVVLPVGVRYDSTVGASRANTTVVGTGQPVPDIGNGVAVAYGDFVTDADGVHEVVTFTFDELPSMRPEGGPSERWIERYGYQYNVPVKVLAEAYDPADTTAPAESWAYTNDPAYATVPARGYATFFADDSFDFDPSRTSIGHAVDTSQLTIAGGLLVSKQSSATGTDGTWGLSSDVAAGSTAYWQVYVSNVLPATVTNATFFDRVPQQADDNASDFSVTMAGALNGAPTGSTVEYSTDATSATTGSWSNNAVGATAFRITVPSIASGEKFSLVIPTSVPVALAAGSTAVNDVEASATYAGSSSSFISNDAQIVVQAAPSMSIVKKTNGVEYSAAPGAIVATGSTVTWDYTVTNTGNASLDTISISDAFTDGAGTSGTLTPTSTVSGPLAAGATRTFTATGTAVAGRYHNTATATAVAVDADGATLPQPVAPVTDESWYLAGDAGLTVVKTTNGQDVSSAPGLPLTPGDEVTWQYVVTNTGSIDLVDVLVTDVDADGNSVFSDTIPALAAGASMTLDAKGTVIEGQYHNTVTASAENPVDAGTPLSGSDDSWYFGVAAGISIDKLVSASASGPWSESVTLGSGSTVYWQLVVTNTGNSELTDVTVTDATLSGIDPIGSLAPGESVTIVIPQKNLTAGYTNTATVTAVDPTGANQTDSDTAKVEVTEVPIAVVGGLALTGSGAVWTLSGAAMLLLAGAAFLLWRRRHASEA